MTGQIKRKTPKLNLLAPLSVSMVVITLGAAFGVLAGRGALIGMISTSAIAIITALIGGSRYGVSSPTGPMTAAIAVILLANQEWLAKNVSGIDAIGLMNLTLIFAAVILIILTLFKVHRLVKFVPNLVISGFVNGIALLIILAQVKSMENSTDWFVMIITFIISFLVSFLCKKFKHIFWRLISGSFFVIVLISFLVGIFELPVTYLNFESTQTLSFALPAFNQIDFGLLWMILPLAGELALIALLDTLLTSIIMDKKTDHKTKFGQELTGQSVALGAVSLFGGIPGAQSTVPSMMLLEEGGHHKLSKILIAVFCLAFTFLFVDLIQFVPSAVFGGIIIKIAFDVADFTSLKTLMKSVVGVGKDYENSKSSTKIKIARLLITLGTAISTVLISLNLAVISFTFLFIFWNKIFPKRLQIPDLKTGQESEGLADEV